MFLIIIFFLFRNLSNISGIEIAMAAPITEIAISLKLIKDTSIDSIISGNSRSLSKVNRYPKSFLRVKLVIKKATSINSAI